MPVWIAALLLGWDWNWDGDPVERGRPTGWRRGNQDIVDHSYP